MAEISERALLMHAEEVPSVTNEGMRGFRKCNPVSGVRKRFNLEEEISSIKVLNLNLGH